MWCKNPFFKCESMCKQLCWNHRVSHPNSNLAKAELQLHFSKNFFSAAVPLKRPVSFPMRPAWLRQCYYYRAAQQTALGADPAGEPWGAGEKTPPVFHPCHFSHPHHYGQAAKLKEQPRGRDKQPGHKGAPSASDAVKVLGMGVHLMSLQTDPERCHTSLNEVRLQGATWISKIPDL